MPLKFNNLESMIQHLDTKAVEHALRVYGTILDHSSESIDAVEKILTRLHDHYLTSQSSAGMFGIAMFYGAYIGELIRKHNFPLANWEGETSGRVFPSLRWHAQHGGESIVFPMSWCYATIIDGPQNNVSFKYHACIERDDAIVEIVEQLKPRFDH